MLHADSPNQLEFKGKLRTQNHKVIEVRSLFPTLVWVKTAVCGKSYEKVFARARPPIFKTS